MITITLTAFGIFYSVFLFIYYEQTEYIVKSNSPEGHFYHNV